MHLWGFYLLRKEEGMLVKTLYCDLTAGEMCYLKGPLPFTVSLQEFINIFCIMVFVIVCVVFIYCWRSTISFGHRKKQNTFPLKCCPWLNHGLAIHVCQWPATPTVSPKDQKKPEIASSLPSEDTTVTIWQWALCCDKSHVEQTLGLMCIFLCKIMISGNPSLNVY